MTPLGEVDLTPQPIELQITDSSIGFTRRVVFEGIRSQSESGEFAQIVWKVWQYDAEENLLNELDAVQGRQVVTPVSGQNRVTADGVTILREGFPAGEVGDRAFEMAWNAGYNEYRYWMGLLQGVPLPQVLAAAGSILSQFERFDRI